ncbi:vitellin-degrading protease-like [Hyposmocoma kahamanoa]|uniref:vitellin-degrading protease-like n=1 Tax=Hyposmocoma kahamanoa TaxID=1477025 RepID=UPI000E6D9754|nr:vitellin-degrading protease-like [Hyposmocoma kahamanoa]
MALLVLVAFLAFPQPGLEEVRIVGGEDIDISEAPYQVSLMYRGRHSCGGTIVANDLIVTAAHCLMGSNPLDYQIRVGSSFNDNGGEIHSVREFIRHPGFNYMGMDNDVAILYLIAPMKFSKEVAPIDMMEKHEEIKDGEHTIITGWGNTREGGGIPQILQKVLVPKISEEVCRDAYEPSYSITPNMLCAGEVSGGKDACQGDSGGPLVYNNKLAGVVSWGLGCARPEYPGVYAKVSALRDWIDENIAFLKLKHVLRAF